MYNIEFKINNEYNNFLYKILNKMPFEDFYWVVTDDEVFDKGGDFLFNESVYKGKDFEKIISQDSYYTVHVKIFAIPMNQKSLNVKDYNDFENSDYILFLRIVDNEFVEVFLKNYDIFKLIMNNIEENKFSIE